MAPRHTSLPDDPVGPLGSRQEAQRDILMMSRSRAAADADGRGEAPHSAPYPALRRRTALPAVFSTLPQTLAFPVSSPAHSRYVFDPSTALLSPQGSCNLVSNASWMSAQGCLRIELPTVFPTAPCRAHKVSQLPWGSSTEHGTLI